MKKFLEINSSFRMESGIKINYVCKFCYLLFMVFILNSTGVFAQFAVVNDKDGYVNVRNSPKVERNNIIDTLHNGSFVFVMEETNNGNWVNIDFRNICNGYIYANRIKYISDYKNIALEFEDHNKGIFKDNNISVEIKIREFNKSKHTINYTNNESSNFISTIDDEKFWGTDGDIPKNEYDYISITRNNLKYFLPSEAIKNLFEPSLNWTKVNYDKENDILYIRSMNSDGAGAYNVIWRIEKGIYKERAVYYGF